MAKQKKASAMIGSQTDVEKNLTESYNEKEKKATKTRKDDRARNYVTIVYPDSCPENWLDILASEKIPCMISPLHDKDVNPTGEPKKPHWHVIFCFEGNKSKDQVKAICDKINGVGLEKVESLRGYARYLCHLDNPEKARYSETDVKVFGGQDYYKLIGAPSDKYEMIKQMVYWCNENKVTNYAVLFNFAMENRYDWFRCLCDSSTMVMKEYLKSKGFEMKMQEERALRFAKQAENNANIRRSAFEPKESEDMPF